MATLSVTTTTDYSATNLTAITTIDFFNPLVSATFLASQFGFRNISTSVTLDGSVGSNTITVNQAGTFSAAGWGFSNWTAIDRIVLNGSSLSNAITGSSQADTINGNDGDDTLIGGLGADSQSGGAGNDTFSLTSLSHVSLNALDTLSGGTGTDTLLLSGGAYSGGFVLNSIEQIAFAGSGASLGISDTALDAVTGVNAVDFGIGDATLAVFGTDVDLGFLTITNFTDGVDVIRIQSASLGASAVGTELSDEIVMGVAAGFGTTFFREADGRGGNDRFILPALLEEEFIIHGGLGIDTLFLEAGAPGDLTILQLDGVERLELGDAPGSGVFAEVTAVQLANGLTTFQGGVGRNQLTINMTLGQALNLGTLTLIDWLSGEGDSIGVVGTTADDLVTGSTVRDRIGGGSGNDQLAGGGGADDLLGGDGDDLLLGGDGGDSMAGGNGVDTVDYSASALGVTLDLALNTGSSGDALGDVYSEIEVFLGSQLGDVLLGNAGFNTFQGLGGDDFLAGLTGRDNLDGGIGNDSLEGGTGFDIVTGGKGTDRLTGGGDSDIFVFQTLLDSRKGARADTITDFALGVDTIDLSAIDAIKGGADDAYAFLTSGPFTAAGQIRVVTRGTDTVVQLNTDADTKAEAEIILTGLVAIGAGDFDL